MVLPPRWICVPEQVLGERHVVFVVPVRRVELQHREFLEVRRGQAFVAEAARELINTVITADDEPLEIRLRRDAEHDLHVQRVVLGEERARERAGLLRVQDRCLDLDEAAPVQKVAQRRRHLRAHAEAIPGLGIRDQVEIPLPPVRLDVLHALVLVRRRLQRLAEEDPVPDLDRQLALVRVVHLPFDAEEVPAVDGLREELVLFPRDLRVRIELIADERDLDVPIEVFQRGEGQLAELPQLPDPPGCAHVRAVRQRHDLA
jgi:hypothetical protein